ncbi:MAG: YMGG-like glycine zipper-containing protein [Pseudomonadota bacterium]
MTSATLKRFPLAMLFLLLGSCTTLPTGPSMMVYPGSGKSFDQFRYDDMRCRQFALEYIGGDSPSQSSAQSGVASAVTGTAVGAAAGALIGGERGAAVGAGTGLLFGTLAGSETAQTSAYYSQHQYDNAYIQCMYANGHLVPMSGNVYRNTRQQPQQRQPMPLPPAYHVPPGLTIPPPPPGPPPPPPPGM